MLIEKKMAIEDLSHEHDEKDEQKYNTHEGKFFD
jgi:hypothetical protein